MASYPNFARCNIVAEEWHLASNALPAFLAFGKGDSPGYFDTVSSLSTAFNRLCMAIFCRFMVLRGCERVGQAPVLPAYKGGVWTPPMRRCESGVDERDELDIASVCEKDQNVRCHAIGMESSWREREVVREE
jgi:hypothetical protein